MDQVVYEGEPYTPGEYDPFVQIDKTKRTSSPEKGSRTKEGITPQTKGSPIEPHPKKQPLRRSKRLKSNHASFSAKPKGSCLDMDNPTRTIWVPFHLEKKRERWMLANSVMAIPKWMAKFSQNLPKEETTRIMKILSMPRMESLRRYHMLLDKVRNLMGREEEADWKLKQINAHKYNQKTKQWYFSIQ